jgi:lipopolysaccharide/colanic/teichoic acid biosynthesis glycosyltransferase
VLGRDLAPLAGTEANVRSTLACVLATEEVEPVLSFLGAAPQIKLSALCLLDGDQARAAALARQLGVPVDTCWDASLAAGDASLIVVSNDRRLITRELAFAIIELALNGAAVCSLTRLVAGPDRVIGPVPERQVVDHLLEVVEADSPGRRIKRALDVAIAGVGLALAAPLLCLVALAIKLDSPGPALLVQERLGRWRRPFPCLKFRTMCDDAERDTGPVWATANDPRITRIGRFLRKSRIDELPQLINVVRGEMSLVGTRPIRRYYADQLADLIPFYDLRFLEKPGLTGWAQIKYRYPSSVTEQGEKFVFDYYYVKNRSIALDLYIMLRTVSVVAGMKGT